MEFIRIFAEENSKLFAVQYDGEEKDAFEQLFENWQDAEYLFDFFEKNENDLNSKFYDYSILEAVRITKREAEDFRDLILETKENGQIIDKGTLYSLFEALSESEYRLNNFKKHKAYGLENKTWLRIYAIEVQDCFVITGGAIKLTRTMNEREHTLLELQKLEKVKAELKDLGIYDQEGLIQ